VTDKGRYALVISISAPGQAVDLYAEVANLVEVNEIGTLISASPAAALEDMGPVLRPSVMIRFQPSCDATLTT
jgi:hypothetical protein